MEKKPNDDKQQQPQDLKGSIAADTGNASAVTPDSATPPADKPSSEIAADGSRPQQEPSAETDTKGSTAADTAKPTATAAKKNTAQSPPAAHAKPAEQSTQPPAAPVPPKQQHATDQPRPATSKLALLALLLAMIALLVIGYGYTLIQKMQIQQSAQVAALQQQLSDSGSSNQRLQQQNGQILGELNQVRSTTATQQSNVDELQTRLSRAMQQVSKLGTDSRKDWLLAEVEYLLRLANQRVLMERTASGALSLLKGADKILQETEDVSIYPVRKALAQNILALEAVPTMDVEGLYLKLVAINSQIDNLRLLPTTDKHQLPEMLQQITADSLSQGLQDGMASSWANIMDKLGNLIVIRHRNDPITPLLSPEQHYFLTQNLHLMLEQIQLALLQGKQQTFDTGLARASSWIDTYFEATDPTTQALLRNLRALQTVEISPSLPDISGSLNQLKIYLAELHKLEGAAR